MGGGVLGCRPCGGVTRSRRWRRRRRRRQVDADQRRLTALRRGAAADARAVAGERAEERRLRAAGGPGYPAWRRDDAYARGEVRRRYRAARAAETAAEEDVAALAALDGRVERADEGLGAGGVGDVAESEGRRESIRRARIDGQVHWSNSNNCYYYYYCFCNIIVITRV